MVENQIIIAGESDRNQSKQRHSTETESIPNRGEGKKGKRQSVIQLAPVRGFENREKEK